MKNGWHTNCEGQVLNPQCPRRLLSSGPVHWPSARGQDSWRVQADSVYVSTWTAPAVVTAWLEPLLRNHPSQDKLASWGGRVTTHRGSVHVLSAQAIAWRIRACAVTQCCPKRGRRRHCVCASSLHGD